jgi:multidrug efflux pump
MTSVATVAGHTPLVFATGPGAGARNSIGIMLVSGMIIGTSFTLFVVPAVYMFVAKNHRKNLDRRGERRSRTEERKLQPALA